VRLNKKKPRDESLGLRRTVARERKREVKVSSLFKKKINLFIQVVFELELSDFSPKISDGIFVGIFIGDFDMLEMLT